LKVPIFLADLNPRVVHLWPILAARRILRKPTILWGAAWPRKGQDSNTTRLRVAMIKLASSVIIYTDRQARELQCVLPAYQITAAPNSLYLTSQCGFEPDTVRNKFVYVGRIVQDKKVALLIQAFAQASHELTDVSLIIVGDGPALEEMRSLAAQLGVAQRVDFRGHVDDVEALERIYSLCIGSISPGYVGLSATQSFSFGVPMIVADSEPHSPEIEAVKPGFNALMFESNSILELADVMRQMTIHRDHWHQKGAGIAEDCRRTYSAEAMATGIIRAVSRELDNSCAVL
jgi:glycosyltransferase involved in cell wall biosynthesis